jgi:ribonuclease HII
MALRKSSTAQPALFASTQPEEPALLLSQSLGGLVAGLDEAGRGPLAGPVVAAAVVLPHPLPAALHGLNDSKQLSEAARDALFPVILAHAVAVGVASIEADVIDSTNILRASLQAMADAFALCQAQTTEKILGAVVDGNQRAPLPVDVVQRTVVSGDAISPAIMAASILAKVTRDRRMHDEHRLHPQYGFDRHKGYGTAVHMAALVAHGPSPIHRRSFAPVAAAIKP